MIPNIIHFVFGLKQNFGDRAFSFVHYLAVVTAWSVNRPDCIYFHYQYAPSGPWWDRARPYLRLNKIEAPERIFGNPLDHFAHRADVVRLEQLIVHGGIYLDMDVVCINALRPLLDNQCVLAREPGEGLCNAVILAAPSAPFLEMWYWRYRDFDQREWDRHSVDLPLRLAEKHPALITILDQFAFFFPLYSDPPHALWMSRREALADPRVQVTLKKRLKHQTRKLVRLKKMKSVYPPLHRFLESQEHHLRRLKRSYCIHLWEQSWWEPYLSDLTPEYIVRKDTNFARIIRYALAGSPALEELQMLADDDVTVASQSSI